MSFVAPLLAWFDDHGRHDLPWHQPRTAYHVWVSEIMLQQTQVQTVIPYYQRFMQRFPDVASLAAASQDEVLAHWSGLGYYARGRNLHQAAQQIINQHDGKFPQDFAAILALPGVGRSTAGAILAQAFNQPYAILDGNVKRVLARYFAIAGWPGTAGVQQQLWQQAEQLLSQVPTHRLADYTQAQMDLGATLCTRSKPRCQQCPVQATCQAWQTGQVASLPSPKPKKTRPTKQACCWLLRNKQGQLWLQPRPAQGIWGGLYSLPETPMADLAELNLAMFESAVESLVEWPSLKHSFSHYHLMMYPVEVRLDLKQVDSTGMPVDRVSDSVVTYATALDATGGWFNLADALALGLPAPIRQLIEQLQAREAKNLMKGSNHG